ncbi:hypothetical protein Pmar_PMAR028751 [Perkinsus marinus ATCC 50983]|uniref:Uncharacterized protein n=1 Tax=Perkinsus marinus (strain ATCC 50983 / TXsc) TaxID=423536 RepID=C5LUK0_PERM5|nr:hypothetical protein Pmar_PMAR028751 [Perkinsus marinus ATCC 50983]EEQ99596.1 hypothetical protein Pmar_PMAR028751 [Perkinsus marinus ATCC 50983]|eukprot:XP_002766879.1 hypothetical protein Pmar_PMAR028751 [Perkinsus marinus ATCC 50983]
MFGKLIYIQQRVSSRILLLQKLLQLPSVKQQSNELIGDYIGRLREGVMEGKCIGLTITQDEILDKFVKGLKPNYQKAVKATYSHIRDVNELCSVLSLWENANIDSSVNAVADEAGDLGATVSPPTINATLEVAKNSSSEVKGERPTRSRGPLRCWHCSGPHLRRNCPVLRSMIPSATPSLSQPMANTESGQCKDPAATSSKEVEKDGAKIPSQIGVSSQSKSFEKLTVVNDVLALAGGSACTVRLVIRQVEGLPGYAARLPALLDTGGHGSAYINANVFKDMVKEEILDGHLDPCGNVTCGNRDYARVLGAFSVNIEDEVKHVIVDDVEVKVIEGLSPDFIIGIETIKRSVDLKRKLIECLGDEPGMSSGLAQIALPDGNGDKLDVLHPLDVRDKCSIHQSESGFTVSCPALSGISVMPFTEPRRKRNRTREIAIHRRLCIAASENKFRAATVREAMVINEVVLVDKKAGSKDSLLIQSDICSMSDEQIKARLRVTLVLRRLAMQLFPKLAPDKSGGYVWIMKSDVTSIISWNIHPSDHLEVRGYYERRHRIILEALRKFVLSVGGSDWYDELVLEQVKWLVNHGEIGQSGICPALLFYGRTLPVPCMKGADDSLVLSRQYYAVGGNRRKLLGVFVKEWLLQRERSLPVIEYESNLKLALESPPNPGDVEVVADVPQDEEEI